MHRFRCFFGFHGPLREEHLVLIERQGPPQIEYLDIPEDAQVRTVYRLSYIQSHWEDKSFCTVCGKLIHAEKGYKHGYVEYNEMIWLRDGQVYVKGPQLRFENSFKFV